jgi:hypothetical protein
VQLEVAHLVFNARLEDKAAPTTCGAFLNLLPLKASIVQARWSGEAGWVPLDNLDLRLEYENHTSHPAPGQILIYAGGVSPTEILILYGGCRFASKVGQLAGNHFLTITEGQEFLFELGQLVLWRGAQEISFHV